MTAQKERPAPGSTGRVVGVDGGADGETVARIFVALLDELADRVAARLGSSAPSHYSKANPPPLVSWRTVLEAGRRGELALLRRGRTVLLERAELERWLADGRLERRGRPKLVAVRDGVTLERLGVVVGSSR